MSLAVAGMNGYQLATDNWKGHSPIRVSLGPIKTQEETSDRCLLARDIC